MAIPAASAVGPAAPPALLGRQVVRFAAVGAASTVLHLSLFALIHQGLSSSQISNLAALLLATVANTAANRTWTFAVVGRRAMLRQHLQGMSVLAITWAASAGALWCLPLLVPRPSTLLLTCAVAASMAFSTVIRFSAMRWWIFARTSA